MPPRALSRHIFTQGIRDQFGHLILTKAEPFRFVDLIDNEFHEVGRGDSLQTLAARKYRRIDPDRACGLWWIIADFQQPPIHDPTIQLSEGSTIVLPSVRTVIENVFDERRRL